MPWSCKAARDLPINETKAWDGAAARARMLDAAGIGGDHPDTAQAQRGFLLVNTDDLTLKGAYSLPFADVVDGKLTALAAGCRAAASRLPQKDGVPDAEQSAARAVLDGYFAKVHGDTNKAVEATTRDMATMSHSFPASVTMRTDNSSLLDILREQHVMDPSVMEDSGQTPHFFRATISNNRLDSYYTRMHPTTLQNYATDAAAGVSVQNSHNARELGFGRSLTGEMVVTPGGMPDGTDLYTVNSDFYIVPGADVNPSTSNSNIVSALRWGTVRDISVGFYDETYRCSVCSRDPMWDFECQHIPGMRYTQVDDNGDPTGDTQAFAWVVGARLAEYSLVYDGSCPGAAVMKARMEAERGRMKPEAIEAYERRYRIRLPEPKRVYTSGYVQVQPITQGVAQTIDTVTTSSAGELRTLEILPPVVTPLVAVIDPPVEIVSIETEPIQMEETRAMTDVVTPEVQAEATRATSTVQVNVATMPLPAEVRSMLEKSSLPLGETVVDTIRAMGDELVRLRPLADDGTAYRNSLIEEAVEQGKRASGNDFPEEQFRSSIKAMPLDMIRFQRDQYQKQADVVLKGGRSTVEESEKDDEATAAVTTRTSRTDDARYYRS